jgi:NAD dependent epimerase/dehydratase family enzyme
MIQQLYYPFYFGLGGTIGFNGSQWLPWIHVTDLAGIFVHAITNDNVSGVLNGTAESATNFDFTKAFAGALRDNITVGSFHHLSLVPLLLIYKNKIFIKFAYHYY